MLRFKRKPLYTAIMLASFGLFCGGVAMGNFLHLAACPLCIIQRMLYLLIGVLALCGLVARSTMASTLSGLAMVFAAGLGSFVAGYQSWLQHHPTGIGCVAESPWWEEFVYWAGAKLPLLFGIGGVCEDASWKLIGLSIAELSCIAFVFLLVASLVALLPKRRPE